MATFSEPSGRQQGGFTPGDHFKFPGQNAPDWSSFTINHQFVDDSGSGLFWSVTFFSQCGRNAFSIAIEVS
jgi:hypothetical protein